MRRFCSAFVRVLWSITIYLNDVSKEAGLTRRRTLQLICDDDLYAVWTNLVSKHPESAKFLRSATIRTRPRVYVNYSSLNNLESCSWYGSQVLRLGRREEIVDHAWRLCIQPKLKSVSTIGIHDCCHLSGKIRNDWPSDASIQSDLYHMLKDF